MSREEARKLIGEAQNLREQGMRKEASWSALKEPIMTRATRAVQLAPKDPEVLFMASWLLQPYATVSKEARRAAKDYQARLDQLGGPTHEVLAIVGGKEAYDKFRRMNVEAGAGCLVTTVSSGLLVAGLGAALSVT